MVNDIKGLFQSKHAVGGLYIGLIGILGAGAMIGMISSNIKKDITYFEKFKLVPKDKPA
jgi:hypothetical protein